jgi:hypothetical protein
MTKEEINAMTDEEVAALVTRIDPWQHRPRSPTPPGFDYGKQFGNPQFAP